MKKSYIVLIIVTVFGAGAIALFPSKHKPTSTTSEPSTDVSDSTTNTTAANPQTTTDSSVSNNSNSNTVATSGTYKTGTFKGSLVSTPYGDLQISIVVANGKISDVTFLQLPNDDQHSAMLNQQASSRLKSQTISTQSATISGVTGATYTSEAYIESLQAAIDAAKA